MKQIFLMITIATLVVSCGKTGMPLPYGYFRVDMPEHAYAVTPDSLNLPYSFEASNVSVIRKRTDATELHWIDVNYPQLHASVYCSYLPVKGNLFQLMEDAHKYVYKHSVKADGIGEKVFQNPEKKVYGILYDLTGNTASSVQFVLTDSVHHFFRGALYFDNVPNKDSIAPMSDYIREDIVHMVETFEWR